MEVLRRHTVYLGWTEHHEVVERFWRVMSQLTDKDRSQFLRFAWGRSRLPKEDPWPRPFKLTYKNAGDEMLPIAHTCFFQLELPQYTTDKIMHDRLLVAINYGVSGEFMLRWVVCCGKSIHFICGKSIHFICGKSIHFIVARVSTSLWHEYPLSLYAVTHIRCIHHIRGSHQSSHYSSIQRWASFSTNPSSIRK